MAQIIVKLTRQQVEDLVPAELFVALGPGIWDPVMHVMSWDKTEQEYTWLLLQYPHLKALQNQWLEPEDIEQ